MLTHKHLCAVLGLFCCLVTLCGVAADTNDAVSSQTNVLSSGHTSDVSSSATNTTVSSQTNAPAISETNTAAAPSPVILDLKDLVTRINEKITSKTANETNLAENLKEFDVLLKKHKDASPEDRGQIVFMKGQLFLQVLDDVPKALETFKQLKEVAPAMQLNGNFDEFLKMLEARVKTQEIQRTLVTGSRFPGFNEKDIAGKPLSLDQYKGKVVLLDFWATWCMPCVMAMPEVIHAYEKYHAKGFDVIGISLDQEKPKLERFIKDKEMPWRQYNDEKGWDSKLAKQYGIEAIPATFLLDRQGRILGKNLSGDELDKAIADALKQK